MTIRAFFLLLIFGLSFSRAQAQTDTIVLNEADNQLNLIENEDTFSISVKPTEQPKIRESRRLVASLLCLTLGPFGMHRLYLGTKPQVAAAYSVTLGGIGILPVVDFFLITFSKDYSRFKNNDNVIMWGEE